MPACGCPAHSRRRAFPPIENSHPPAGSPGFPVENSGHVVFDKRYVVAGQQLKQCLLFFVGHQAAQGILEGRHQPAGLGAMPLDCLLHGIQLHAFPRVGGNFHCFELMLFQ